MCRTCRTYGFGAHIFARDLYYFRVNIINRLVKAEINFCEVISIGGKIIHMTYEITDKEREAKKAILEKMEEVIALIKEKNSNVNLESEKHKTYLENRLEKWEALKQITDVLIKFKKRKGE